jgi:hypothetical protein
MVVLLVVVVPLEEVREVHSFGMLETDLAAVKRRREFQAEVVLEGGGSLPAVEVL